MKNQSIKIGNKTVGHDSPIFVIAEAGVNHNGDLKMALDLIDAAADAKADAVKFQTFKAEQVVTKAGKMAEYQKANLGKDESQLEMVKKLELDEKHWPVLIAHAKKRGIIFFSSPHGHTASADLLQKLGVPAFKFGSGDITNLPLLEHVAKFDKPMILGTGMSTMEEVKEAVAAIKKAGNDKIVLLHCTTDYPLALENVNLLAMQTMEVELGMIVGYSDHTKGYLTAVMAVALGACVIEKHLTLDKSLPGPDHVASSDPAELKEYVAQIRAAEVILGDPRKAPSECEKQYIDLVRKSLVAAQDIEKGDRFSAKNVTVKRPGSGMPPKLFKKVMGKKARQMIKKDELLTKKMIA